MRLKIAECLLDAAAGLESWRVMVSGVDKINLLGCKQRDESQAW
jgi:hypothetical protein